MRVSIVSKARSIIVNSSPAPGFALAPVRRDASHHIFDRLVIAAGDEHDHEDDRRQAQQDERHGRQREAERLGGQTPAGRAAREFPADVIRVQARERLVPDAETPVA